MAQRIRKIIHIDMDCFYAAIEMRDNPSLAGNPVAVGGASARSVLCTCNYEARKYGIRAGMSSLKALQKCDSLILIPVYMQKYKEVSSKILKILSN